MLTALLVMFFQAAAGQPTAPAPVPSSAPAAAAGETAAETDSEREARLRALRERQKLVCRNEVTLGSRLPKRVCTSQADDATAKNDSRDWINRTQSQMPTNY